MNNDIDCYVYNGFKNKLLDLNSNNDNEFEYFIRLVEINKMRYEK